jgi:hypothetical protein
MKLVACMLVVLVRAATADACGVPDAVVKLGLSTPDKVVQAAQAKGALRNTAIYALTELCGTTGTRVLAQLIGSSDVEAMDAAAMVLHDRDVIRALTARLRDRHASAEVRVAAHDALVWQGESIADAYRDEIEALRTSLPAPKTPAQCPAASGLWEGRDGCPR